MPFLMTTFKFNHLQTLSHWDLGIQHINLIGVHRYLIHNSLSDLFPFLWHHFGLANCSWSACVTVCVCVCVCVCKLLDNYGVIVGKTMEALNCSVAQSCPTLCNPMDCSPPGPSMGVFRQEYWSVLPFPSPGNLPHPGIEPASSILAGRFFTTEPPGKP